MDIKEQIAVLEQEIVSWENAIKASEYESNYYQEEEDRWMLQFFRGHERDCEQKIQELQIKIKQLKEAA